MESTFKTNGIDIYNKKHSKQKTFTTERIDIYYGKEMVSSACA